MTSLACRTVAFIGLGAWLQTAVACEAMARQDTLPAYRMVAGRLNVQHLPFGERFRIRGSPATPSGPADVVRLTVTDASDARVKDAPSSSCWVRSTASPMADSVFDVAVIPPLRLERAYRMKLEFFRRTPASEMDSLAVLTARAVIDTLVKRGTTSIDTSVVTPVWSDELRRRLQERGGTPITLTTLGQCPDAEGLRILRLSVSAASTVGRAVVSRRVLASVNVQQRRDSFTVVKAEPGYIPLRARLLTVAQDPESQRRFDISPERVSAVLQAFDNDTAGPPESEAALGRLAQPARTGGPHPLSDAERSLLARLLRAHGDLVLEIDKQSEAELQVRKESAAVDSIPALPGQLEFMALGAVDLTETAWTDSTTAKAVRIGTAFALGPVLLGLCPGCDSPGTEGEVVALALLKIHLGPVDRRHPDAFAEAKSRWAINVGVKIKSDLNYRGQRQEDLFSGLMPALGMSYDRDRLISINAGALLYRQPSPNPFNTGRRSGPRAAPYLMVGLELDLINRLTGFLR